LELLLTWQVKVPKIGTLIENGLTNTPSTLPTLPPTPPQKKKKVILQC